MTFKAGRVSFSFGYLPLAAACVCAVLFGRRFAACLLCTALHEMGHIAALLTLGDGDIAVSLGFLTVDIVDKQRELRCGRARAAIAAAGPAANVLTLPVFLLLHIAFGGEFFYLCAMVSGALCVFNLLPAAGTDGGELVQTALQSHLSYETAAAVSAALTVIFLLPAAVCAFYVLIVSKNNFTLLIAVMCLLCSFLKGIFKATPHKDRLTA